MSTSNKTLSGLTFTDPHPRPLTLAECEPHRVLVFREAPPSWVFFLDKGARAGGGAFTLIGPRPTVLQASKKNQIIQVNKCNKTNINIVKDIHRKTHSISRNVRCLRWVKISLQNICSKTPNTTPSHLSFFSLHNNFGIIYQDICLSPNFGNLLSAGGFAFNSNPCDHIITITRSLRLKQAYY
jgi:hypothetical protein